MENKNIEVKRVDGPVQVDMRTTESTVAVFEAADGLIEWAEGDINKLLDIERSMFEADAIDQPNTLEHLVVKAAISKSYVQQISEPTHISMVVPMYHEITRISPRANSSTPLFGYELTPQKHGENSILRKHAEMYWLTKDSKVSYDLILVDDMCDQSSGEQAQALIEGNQLQNSTVLYLQDGITSSVPGTLQHDALEKIISQGESIRGGALCYGFAHAVEAASSTDKRTFIGYVDADSSYSLTQIGIPLKTLLENEEVVAATASRQHPLTHMEATKEESQTSHRSPGLIRLKQVTGYLRRSVIGDKVPADTQSGFKLFEPEILEQTLRQPNKKHNFTYDTQLLARIARNTNGNPRPIETFGVVCLDCDELSTANNGHTYFDALNTLAELANEADLDPRGNVMWLLNHLTANEENYYRAIHMLEDTTNTSDLPIDQGLLSKVRNGISTDRDTTAVGDYFTEDLFNDVVSAFKAVESTNSMLQ